MLLVGVRARNELGFDIPLVVDWGDDKWLRFADARRCWMAEFTEALSNIVRRQRPGASLTHQSGGYVDDWESGSSERLSQTADWLSADLYQDRASLSVSLKLFESMSKHHPAELIQSWCTPTIFEHNATKTSAEIMDTAAAAVSNGTGLSIIEAINPDGTTSVDRYERARPVFEYVAQLEPVLGGDRVADIAIYRSFAGNFDADRVRATPQRHGVRGRASPQASRPSGPSAGRYDSGETFLERHLLFTAITRTRPRPTW